MTLESRILAILSGIGREMTVREIRADDRIVGWWRPGLARLHVALAWLEEEGLVESRWDPQPPAPERAGARRRLYRIGGASYGRPIGPIELLTVAPGR